MKKLILSLFVLTITSPLFAGFRDMRVSSYTDIDTSGPIMFSSAPMQFIAITISTPAPNSFVSFFRSTSPVFNAFLTTQTKVNTWNGNVNYIPMYDMYNESYTFMNKVGNAEITIWYECTGLTSLGVCPGLDRNGGRK
jgi:hypothetical protein